MNKFIFDNVAKVIGDLERVVFHFDNRDEVYITKHTGDVVVKCNADDTDYIISKVGSNVTVTAKYVGEVPDRTRITWDWESGIARCNVLSEGEDNYRIADVKIGYVRCITSILAMTANGGIGFHGTLPWRLPIDLKWFKYVTTLSRGKLVMGRKTWESVNGFLPDREIVVLTRDVEAFNLQHPSVVAYSSREELLEREFGNLVICGGAEIYELFREDYLINYITVVNYDGLCDVTITPWVDLSTATVIRTVSQNNLVATFYQHINPAAPMATVAANLISNPFPAWVKIHPKLNPNQGTRSVPGTEYIPVVNLNLD